jgi:hypothetical protein
VWNKKDKEYLDPDYYEEFAITPDGVIHVGLTVDNGICDEFQTIPPSQLSVEYCTGILDKKRNLIYEEDIVKDTRNGKIYIVSWYGCDAGFRMVLLDGEEKFNPKSLWFANNCFGWFEIIGNIHDDQFRDATKMVEGD